MNLDEFIKDQILKTVEAIMINDGPDGHCDGAGVIAEYIYALIKGEDEQWKAQYNEEKMKSYNWDINHGFRSPYPEKV